MITAVQTSSTRRMTSAVFGVHFSDKALGLALASVLPALFWTAIFAIAGSAFGQTPAATTLICVGLSIATFLAVIVGGLMARQT